MANFSRNFFAQADDGTVYYFGEVVDDYDGMRAAIRATAKAGKLGA